MIDPKSATRKIIVEGVQIFHRGPSFSRFPKHPFSKNTEKTDVWEIIVTLRRGLLPSYTTFERCFSEEEVSELESRYQIGKELSGFDVDEEVMRSLFRSITDKGRSFGVQKGDYESPLAIDTLWAAGIYKAGHSDLSEEVTDFLGADRTMHLKDKHGDYWQEAAAFEYAFVRLDHSSPAFVAASYQYHTYIAEDDFLAGYMWRDLEILFEGVETEAVKAKETRKKAGIGGSKKSRKARETRRQALLEKMFQIASRSPDVVKFGPLATATLALEECAKEDEPLWRQGRRQIAEYVGEARRGEAGTELKERYLAVFGAKPLKRL